LLHELGHEWWGNLVTNADWKDFWLHEGFQSFMDTLYVEEIADSEAYFKHMLSRMKQIRNKQPVAPLTPSFSYQVYMLAPDYLKSDGDIYNKGAYILHTLRYLIGDVAFFKALRKMAYPTPAMEKLKNGYQVRFVTTDDFITIAEQESNMKLDWFFRTYLRQPALPKLVVKKIDGKTELSWETPDNLEFPMPVEIELNGKLTRVEMHRGKALIENSPSDLKIDPRGWILKIVDFKTQY
jgi:aminopeptidase N